MSAIQSGIDLNSTNLTSGYAKQQNTDNLDSKPTIVSSSDKASEQSQSVTSQNEVKNADNLNKNLPLTSEQLEKVAQQLQDFVGGMNKGLEFLVDKDSGRDVIKVIDKKSGDLIKQYPSEEVLSLVSKLSDAAGALVNEKI